jgi:glucosamine--fructose-6-phosphate aminotransferase (isomerizing)
VEKTLENKLRQSPDTQLFTTYLDETVIPPSLEADFKNDRIKKIYFIGQGTAGIAAQGCADLLNFYLGDRGINIRALKSSELSGFSIAEGDNAADSMIHTLVVAISQSGTTTDTNRTVDMAKACGARTLAIVNRRDSDLTFKTDGVLYTSSGRDIEMSVASTKAFYSQITAGALLGLHLAGILQARSPQFITGQVNELMGLPDKMRTILGMKEQIKASADRLAVSKQYWATVGSGSNKASADEIRIKLSELCYKTISSDFIEDKKHIDLSSEPLIIICAAGTRESVLGDIIKDTAIFHAHKAAPVVITTMGEDRFDLYAADVFKIPETMEHFAPVLNTLVGHIWGYYAALAINEGSRFMYEGRAQVQEILDEYTSMGHDVYEVLLEKKFRESIALFYNKFSKNRRQGKFPVAMGLDNVANITLLLKYLSGRLPVSDFEVDFETKGTPTNMLNTFFENMGHAVNIMARPVDAIKHQAKTVTVGTSRISEKFEGRVFDELVANKIQIAQITNKNVLVIKNLQEVIQTVNGGFLYQISGLSLLGDVTPETKIKVTNKTGALKDEASRVETDPRLKGTKNIIVREGNVYIGKGRKDGKNILVIPIISSNPATPNIIEYILSLNISFKPTTEVPLLKKIKALGGKYNRLKDWILESDNFQWDDSYLNLIDVETLFGDTAETVVEKILEKIE